MAKQLFKRCIWLVDTIQQAGKITFDEINNKWKRSSLSDGNDLPKKTFHNHKDAIEDVFGIIIMCDIRDDYKYYIENPEEISSESLRRWLLNTFTISNLISESQKLKNRILFEEIPSGQQYLAPIIEAMRDGNKIEITYQSFWKEHANTFEIEPYFVKVFKQRWYVVAYSEGRDKIMIYALDRIQQLSVTDNKFDFPEDFNAEEYFFDCYGIVNDESIKPCIVEIKTSLYQAKYLRSLPLHHSQKEIKIDKEEATFQYYLKPTFDFKKELLSMGVEVEVLVPEWLRKEMRVTTQINNVNKL